MTPLPFSERVQSLLHPHAMLMSLKLRHVNRVEINQGSPQIALRLELVVGERGEARGERGDEDIGGRVTQKTSRS